MVVRPSDFSPHVHLPDTWRELVFGAEPVDAEEREAFTEYVHLLTGRTWPVVGAFIGFAALAWWPLDLLVYPDQPEVRAQLGWFRLSIAALDFGFAALLPRVLLAFRHPLVFSTGAALTNVAVAGWTAGRAGQGSLEWLGFGFVVPQFSALLLVPLWARLPLALSFAAVFIAAWAATPEAPLTDPSAWASVSYMGFAALLAAFLGHSVYRLLRDGFLLRRRVEQQRVGLEDLAARLDQRVTEQTLALREMQGRAEATSVEQRRSLARDLHDDLGQELTSMRLLVGVGRQLKQGDDELLSELDGQVERTQQSLRRVLEALQPRLLEGQSLGEALRLLVAELRRRSALDIRLDLGVVPEPLPDAVTVVAYRAAQEALTNALRHARARSVRLELAETRRGLRLAVEDDGAGLAPDHVPGRGMAGIRDRVAELGGEVTWSSAGGTRVEIELPLPEAS